MRLFYIPVLGMAAISIASAGQIEIGAGQNGSGISTQGLTSAYIGATTWSEKNYTNNLFANDTISNGSLNGVTGAGPTGTGTTLPSTANGFQQFTDPNNDVTFGMMNDPATGDSSNNYWASPASASSIASSISLPVDVSGVTSANILLNDYYGVASQTHNDTVEFFFNGGAVTQSFFLTNGKQIDSTHDCTSVTPACPNLSGATTSANTDAAWTGSYVESVTTTPFSGTTGSVSLIDIGFNLSLYAGDILTGIVITDDDNLVNSSRLALSAVTVSGADAEVATPEPSTVLLLLAGLGVMGFLGQRRKARL
jgi:hypothetical protein